MEASALTRQRAAVLPRSRRLLGAFGDDRLVEQVRRGNAAAFEVIFDRHYKGILSFCRHMLGSREEAEDAVQHTFASAYSDLQSNDRDIRLKAWLYTIARNRCLSVLRARREQAAELADGDLPTAGLSEQVQQRADLQELLADLRELPHDQREALVLFEIGDLSQAEVASVIGVDPVKVKALVFQARSALIENREARAIPCSDIREQLATASGGALRRGPLRRHLKSCEGCREYRDQVKTQRRALAALLPVVPTVGLKQSVLGAIGLGGGGAGGGGIAAGGGLATGAAGVGSNAAGGAGFLASFGGFGAAKLAVAATLGTGALVGGGVAVHNAAGGGDGTDSAQAAERSGGGTTGNSGTAGNPAVGNPGLGSPALVGNAGDDPAGTKDDRRRDGDKKSGRAGEEKSNNGKSGDRRGNGNGNARGGKHTGRSRGSSHSGGRSHGNGNGNGNAGGRSGATTRGNSGGRGSTTSNGNRGGNGRAGSGAKGGGSSSSNGGGTREPATPSPPPAASNSHRGDRGTPPPVPPAADASASGPSAVDGAQKLVADAAPGLPQ